MLQNYNFHVARIGNTSLPVLLFLHGFMGNVNDLNSVISQLSATFYCVAVDLPGHGKTQVLGGNECYTMSETAAGLIQWLDQFNINSCSLVGYSMGGRLALYLSLHYPERFNQVILESASPGLKTEKERLQRRQLDLKLANKLEKTPLEEFLQDWYNQPLFKSLKAHPYFDQILENRLNNNPVELAKSLRNLGTGNQPSLWDKLSHNQVPLYLLVGERDKKFIEINQAMASLCPVAHLEIIPNCGHNIHVEHPQQWVKAVQAFCEA